MAVDTRSKRASVLGVAMAATLTLPQPDGAVGQADRQHLALSYAGVSAVALVTLSLSSRTDVVALAPVRDTVAI